MGRASCLKRVFAVCLCLAMAVMIYLTQFGRRWPASNLVTPVNFHRLYPSNWTLINLKRFEFISNSDVCQDSEQVQLLVSVTSHPGHVALRRAFRRALPSDVLKQFRMRRIFLLGRIDPNQKGYAQVNQSAIEEEHIRHGDIVQGDFVESYRNLTYKHVMGLKYALHFCNHTKYFLKMDDDIAVDLFRLLDLLGSSTVANGLNIVGSTMTSEERNPLRNPKSKWYVTYEDYPMVKYPHFVSGWAYVTSIPAIEKLVHFSEQSPYFWIDDVFVTGLLANLSNIAFVDIRSKFTVYEHDIECCVDRPEVLCQFLVGPCPNAPVMENFYRHVLNCHLQKCSRSEVKKCRAKKRPVMDPESMIKGQVIPLSF